MKVAIDTNSLLSLVRYYLPFDKASVLFDFIKEKISIGEIIVIDKVLEECTYNSQGLVLKSLPFLEDKAFLKLARLPYKTDALIAPSPGKFLRQVDNQFVNAVIKKKLTDVQYENQKNHFLEDADMKLIIFCLSLKSSTTEEVILVTEETGTNNDNKLFKKIPAICKELSIQTLTLPQLLARYKEIQMEFK